MLARVAYVCDVWRISRAAYDEDFISIFDKMLSLFDADVSAWFREWQTALSSVLRTE